MPVELKKQEPERMDDMGKEYYGRGPAPRKAAPSAEIEDDGLKAAEIQSKIQKEKRMQSTDSMETIPKKKGHRAAADSGRVITPKENYEQARKQRVDVMSKSKIRMRP